MTDRIGFIGTGVMGSAIAKAVAKGGQCSQIYLANRTKSKASALAEMINGAVCSTNNEIAEKCDVIFVCVKPQMMEAVLKEIAPVLAGRKDRFILSSMAAGITCEKICEFAGADYPVIRIMPNTPSVIGSGVIEYCGHLVSEEEQKSFEILLSGAGVVDRLKEELIDAATAVTGCGPAFAYMFAEALADGGVACGLTRDKANIYAAAMLEGAAKMILQTGSHPGKLKDAVCSPAGTTIAGVRKLEECGFRGAVMDAVIASYEKTLSLK